jgi:Na+-driven multidrug efflux pump
MALLRQVVLFLPLVVILPRFFTRNVEGVFYAQLITDLVVLIIGVFLMASAFRSMRTEEKANMTNRKHKNNAIAA